MNELRISRLEWQLCGTRMIQFQFFPRSVGLTQPIAEVVDCFHTVAKEVASPENNLSSDGVLRVIRPHLEKLGYRVEVGKNRARKSRSLCSSD
jgi:hypothetical protein